MRKKSVKFSLAAKILIITLLIVVVSNAMLSSMSIMISKKNIKNGVYNQLNEIADNLSNKFTASTKRILLFFTL